MRFFLSAIMIGGLALVPTHVTAEQESWSTIGTLACTIGPNVDLPMGARQQAQCTFRSRAPATVATYTGSMERAGPDLALIGGKLVWIVLSPDGLPPQSLFGRYSEARGETAGALADAALALCRSSQRTICLEPLAEADHEDGDNYAFSVSAVLIE